MENNEEKNFINELKEFKERVTTLEKTNETLNQKLEKQLIQFDKEKKQLKSEIINELEKKEFKRREENKSKYIKILLTVFSFSIVVLGIVIFVNNIKTKSPSQINSKQIQEYSSFIDNWNKQVKNLTTNKTFLLSFSKNNENIQKLNSLLQNFYIAEITDSSKYNDFLEKNKFDRAIILNTRMKEEILLNHLKEVTKKTVISSIVKKILMMNDKNIWEKYKNDE